MNTSPHINPMGDLVADAGRVLYGDRWQAPLSRALGISERLLRYWLNGNDAPSHRQVVALCGLLDERAKQYDDVSLRLCRARAEVGP